MNELHVKELKVDLQRTDGAWHVVIERDGQRHDVGGINELIRYLESLAAANERPARGLR